MLRLSISSLLFSLLFSPAAAADIPNPGRASGECLRLTVSANDLASFGDQGRQHYLIVFENRCETVRIVYWCAEHPSKVIAMAPVCMRTSANAPAIQPAGIAAPLYAVVRQREFQWTFPPGTRIRFVDCSDSSVPTSDFRCTTAGKRP